MGRFINADVLISTGGILGNNMFAYCGNNPVIYVDPSGTEYRLVGGGLQFEIDWGGATVGVEIIVYWDTEECEDGGLQIAVYCYGGVSLPADNPMIAAMLATITDNTDILIEGSEAEIIALATLLSNDFSISVSAVAIWGDETFISTESYEGSFSSVGVAGLRAKGGIALSENCVAVSLGGNLVGYSVLPTLNVSKTYYVEVCEFNTKSIFSPSNVGSSKVGGGGR